MNWNRFKLGGGLALLLGLVLAVAPVAPAKAAKTLPGIAYTHTTPVKARGTWYTHIRHANYLKTVVKKHTVTWSYKAKRSASWKRWRRLSGKHLYVYRFNLTEGPTTLHMFGFYAAHEKGNAFHFIVTRKVKGKTIPVMVDANGSENYHAWKNVK